MIIPHLITQSDRGVHAHVPIVDIIIPIDIHDGRGAIGIDLIANWIDWRKYVGGRRCYGNVTLTREHIVENIFAIGICDICANQHRFAILVAVQFHGNILHRGFVRITFSIPVPIIEDHVGTDGCGGQVHSHIPRVDGIVVSDGHSGGISIGVNLIPTGDNGGEGIVGIGHYLNGTVSGQHVGEFILPFRIAGGVGHGISIAH
mmetsp:Transcript_32451/g.58654  ORF Transcript_32451/g.58654 Transcript_32451/m.58654 type:complete len:203 (+) Transcript_32451:3898-4506(+)